MFTAVKYLETFPNGNNSPAAVNRKTRELFINLSRWRKIQPEHRVFILLHELAHCVLDSSNEMAVDALAHEWYLQLGYSLSESVYALTKVLHANSEQNKNRSWAQYNRASSIDELNKKNYEFEGYAEISEDPKNVITNTANMGDSLIVTFDTYDLDGYDFDLEGELSKVKGISRKEFRRRTRTIRLYKRMGRAKKKNAIANDVQAGADTRKTYAEKGIYVPTRAESIAKGVGGAMQGIAGAMGAAFGKGGGAGAGGEDETPQPPQQPPRPAYRTLNTATQSKQDASAKNNQKYYIMGGIALTALCGILLISK